MEEDTTVIREKSEQQKQTLIIDRSSSSCGNCGRGCSPLGKTHDVIIEYSATSGEKPGCGIEWRYLRSNYVGGGMAESCKKMRPDLIWVGFDD